jgi:hypothetical protein
MADSSFPPGGVAVRKAPLDRGAYASFLVWLSAGVVSASVSFAFGQSQNLMVFRQASRDLLAGEDLYVKHAADYFKYSPTFALLFAPLALLPAWLSACLWGALNFGVAWAGIHSFVEDRAKRERALPFALFGVLLATDGDQSNLLVLGLFLLAMRALGRGKGTLFAALLGLGAAIKVFPLLGALALLFHPRRAANAARLAVAGAVLVALPLVVTSAPLLARDYASWNALLARDHANVGWSVMSLLQEGAGLRASNMALQGAALLVLAVPVGLAVRYGADDAFRRTFAAQVLVFGVIMNHRAEYATFVIFAGAAAVWWAQAEVRPSRTLLVAMAFVAVGPFFTRADPSVTGAFSVMAAHRLFHPLRVLPALLVWLWMQRDLLARFVTVRVEFRPDAALARLEERHAP